MLPLRESDGFRRFPFELHRFGRSWLKKNRYLVAVLVATLVDDFLHFFRRCFRKRERTDTHVVPFRAQSDLCVIRVHEKTFKFIQPRGFGLWLHGADDDGYGGINDDGNRGHRILRSSRRRKNARRRKHQGQADSRNFGDALHSTSSVAIRKDFKNLTSWGVMASLGAGFLSFSSRKDS